MNLENQNNVGEGEREGETRLHVSAPWLCATTSNYASRPLRALVGESVRLSTRLPLVESKSIIFTGYAIIYSFA
jgi:hypothetical protein